MPPVVVGTPSTQASFSTVHTLSHAVPSGANRLLLVAVSELMASGAAPSVTYGGTSMPLIGSAATGSFHRTAFYILINPPVGTANVVVTGPSEQDRVIAVVNLTGVHQSSPIGSPATNSGAGTASSITVSAAADDLVIDGISWYDGAYVPNAGQTSLVNVMEGNGDYFGMSSKPGATSVVMGWTNTEIGEVGHIGVAIKPAATVTGLEITSGAASATANGASSTLRGGFKTTTGAGAATGNGLLATLRGGLAIGSSVASATADGLSASLGSGLSVTSGSANATADGLSASVGSGMAITSDAGNAEASGLMVEVEMTPTGRAWWPVTVDAFVFPEPESVVTIRGFETDAVEVAAPYTVTTSVRELLVTATVYRGTGER